MSCWDLDLPTETARDQARRADSGRYSLVLTDSDASDFEETASCVACEEHSTGSLDGLKGWLVLRRRNGTTLALCPPCTDRCEPPRRNRS